MVSCSSTAPRLLRSTIAVHQHHERVQHTADGCGQVREVDLQSFVFGCLQPLSWSKENEIRYLLAENWEKGQTHHRQHGTQGLPKILEFVRSCGIEHALNHNGQVIPGPVLEGPFLGSPTPESQWTKKNALPGAFPSHTSRPQATRREARVFSIQTVEFTKRPRMNSTSCRRDRTPYCSPAVPEGESLCHTSSKPSVVSTWCRSERSSPSICALVANRTIKTPHTTWRKAWRRHTTRERQGNVLSSRNALTNASATARKTMRPTSTSAGNACP